MKIGTCIQGLVVAAAFLSGCSVRDNKTVFHQYRAADASGWYKYDTLYFDIPPMHDSTTAQITLEIRSTPQFDHERLWVGVQTDLLRPETSRTDTVALVLIKPSGENTGTGVNLFEHEKPLYSHPLPQGQYGRIAVYHLMQLHRVSGISDIGIRIQR